MNKSFNFIILSLFIFYIKSENDFNDFKCFEPTSNKLKIGEDIVLCIHLLNFNKEEPLNKKIGIRVKVDEYSVISIDGIYQEYYNRIKNDTNSNIELLAQISNVTSIYTSVSFKI